MGLVTQSQYGDIIMNISLIGKYIVRNTIQSKYINLVYIVYIYKYANIYHFNLQILIYSAVYDPLIS